MSEDSMLIVNDCVPDENAPENTFILFIFRVCKFWRGERKDENTANAALQFCIYNVTENLSIFFLQHFILIFYFTANWLECKQ